MAALAALLIADPTPAAEPDTAVPANAATDAASPPAADSRSIPDFALEDVVGRTQRLADLADKPIVVVTFLGTECPLAKLYGPRLGALHREYADRGVAFLAINSNQQDSLTEWAAYGRTLKIDVPLLKDPGNRVADLFDAERTPEVFVLDAARRIAYRGRIDDQYGIGTARHTPVREDLRLALDALLAGRPVPTPRTRAMGCFIGRVQEPDPASKVTWSGQVAAIFHRHCVECHRPGEIGPFSLTSYDEVAGWGETIDEVVREQRMPPWHANPAHGRFRNARGMTDDEKELVYAWVAAGCPQGDPAETPSPPQFHPDWQLPRDPDQVVAMRDRPFTVPAEGTVDYQYFVVDPQFTEDRWVSAAEIIPGNRGVVHHAICFVRPPDDASFRGIGWLAGYVPGQRLQAYDASLARRIPAGSKLVFQMHYTPNGGAQNDLTKIGLVFADPAEVREEIITLLAINQTFEIPPHAADHRVEATLRRFPSAGRLLAIVPHMHVRGKAFRVQAEQADGQTDILLDVPHYDFNWQSTYLLDEPLAFPPQTLIRCVARFDNSAANLNNPDPSAAVRWGDQTWEEMALGYFAVAVPRDAPEEPPVQTADDEAIARQAQAKAETLFRELDADGDGVVRRSEVTEQFAAYGFRRYDADGDEQLTRDELRAAVEKSLRRKRRQSSNN